ncbi:MAG: mechanosensitive ion channel [candidate division Zixibacteria bacterium]|nr:mechanosensitive ion channel [candidate division Zixibacteria bacterium]
MIDLIKTWLTDMDITGAASDYLSWGLAIVIVAAIALVTNFIVRKILLRVIRAAILKSKSQWDDAVLQSRLFDRLANLAPALVIYFFAPAFGSTQFFIQRLAISFMILVGLMAANSFLNSIDLIYRSYEISKQRPIKGYLQVVKIFLFLIGGILVISFLMDRSPWVFLSGLGALTAVLLLVFKDSILGLVASVQLSTNNMVRIGDWIEMAKYGADGDIIDVSLNTVKVQNWDKTITTIPTYALMSDSFKNWRGMSESGGRRIKRAIAIDMNSVKFCSEEMLTRFVKFQLIADYMKRRKNEIAEFNNQYKIDTSELVNGRNMTNLGTFRAYIKAYLKDHPRIHKDMTFLVRQLPPGPSGIPIEIYVFSNDQVWANYEAIQADIFDHILAVIPRFDLRVFQNPSGADFRKITPGG